MQTIKTVETQVPFLKESFFTTTFKGRRKSSVTNILRKQQHSIFNQQHQQQQCILEHQQQPPKLFFPPLVENGKGQHTPEHQRLARSSSSPLCKTAEHVRADGHEKEGQKERKDHRDTEAVKKGGGERGVSGSEHAAVSASRLLLSVTAERREATSFSKLPLTVVGREQESGYSDRTVTIRGPAASQEESQHAQPRPQQHGLIAKGVRLLRIMGNQEAKQKKAAGGVAAAGHVSCDGDADEREVDKKSKKSHQKISKTAGESSDKSKSKSESKGSMFSGMRIRKSLSKAKGLSKDDILDDGRSKHLSNVGNKPADDKDMLSDGEGNLSCLTTDDQQTTVDEIQRKTSSESDADLYSFHSAAAENDDLLYDIQQAMSNQYVVSNSALMAGHLAEGLTSEKSTATEVISNKLLNVDNDIFTPLSDCECALQDVSREFKHLENESCVIPISRNSSGLVSLSESGPSSGPDTEKSSASIFPKTNSTYSFPDTATTTTSYESAEEPLEDLESPVLYPQLTKHTCVPCVNLDPVFSETRKMASQKSVSSMDLSVETEETGKQDFLSLKRRKSSLSSTSSRTFSRSSSTVKLYPPINPSYVKTTTRQLSSPVSSPIASPDTLRKTNTIASVDCSGGRGFKRPKQRSCSIAGPISVSTDWTTEQYAPEKGYGGGAYWTLGSRRTQHASQISSTSAPYLDVFSEDWMATLSQTQENVIH